MIFIGHEWPSWLIINSDHWYEANPEKKKADPIQKAFGGKKLAPKRCKSKKCVAPMCRHDCNKLVKGRRVRSGVLVILLLQCLTLHTDPTKINI